MRLGRKRMNSVKRCEIKFVILFCPIICDSVGLLRMFLSCREKFFLKTEPLLCCQLVSLNNANDCNRPSTRTRQIDCKSPKALSKASPEKKAQPKPKLGHITQSLNRLPKLLTKPAMRRNARTNSFGITWCCFATRNISKMFTSRRQPRTNYSIFLRSDAEESTLRRKNIKRRKKRNQQKSALRDILKLEKRKLKEFRVALKKSDLSPKELKYRRVVSWFYSALGKGFFCHCRWGKKEENVKKWIYFVTLHGEINSRKIYLEDENSFRGSEIFIATPKSVRPKGEKLLSSSSLEIARESGALVMVGEDGETREHWRQHSSSALSSLNDVLNAMSEGRAQKVY